MVFYKEDFGYDAIYPYYRKWADNAYAFISPYVTGLTHTMGSTDIDFWGKFTVRITESNYPVLSLIHNEVEKQLTGGEMEANRRYRFALVYADNFLFFSMTRDMGGSLSFMWFVDEDNKEYIGGSRANRSFAPSGELYDSQSIWCLDDMTANYSFAKPFTFGMPVGKIAFAEKHPVITGGNMTNFVKGMMSCSSVGYRTTITINNKNYFAVDTNTLCCLDAEGEET